MKDFGCYEDYIIILLAMRVEVSMSNVFCLVCPVDLCYRGRSLLLQCGKSFCCRNFKEPCRGSSALSDRMIRSTPSHSHFVKCWRLSFIPNIWWPSHWNAQKLLIYDGSKFYVLSFRELVHNEKDKLFLVILVISILREFYAYKHYVSRKTQTKLAFAADSP